MPALLGTATLLNSIQAYRHSITACIYQMGIYGKLNVTRDQRNSLLWYNVRCYRITASVFGTVLQRKLDTPPDSLVLRILQPKCSVIYVNSYHVIVM